MYWNDDDKPQEYVVSEDVVDINFKISCTHLPLDHAHILSQAILQKLPWAESNPYTAIHLIHGAESGNGWIRPEGPDEVIYPSRRTLFSIRTSSEHVDQVSELANQTVMLDDIALTLTKPTIRKLSKLTTIFARYLVAENVDNEEAFLTEMYALLKAKGIKPSKMMSGRIHTMQFPDNTVSTRSLMLDGIEIPQSVQLQQEGLGQGRLYGCGIFLPHKGIDAVGDAQEK